MFRTALGIALLILAISACKNTPQKRSSANTIQENKAEASVYISYDNATKLSVVVNNEEEISVTNLITGNTYRMKREKAASGEKYSSSNGFVFWTKGNDFMWMKGDSIIASGKLRTNDVTGIYVSPDYFKRDKGYDWVGIRIKPTGFDHHVLQVRSRADTKKPTCTWDTDIYPESDNNFYTVEDGVKVHFTFSNDTLSIAAEDEKVLYFQCSGGATIAGQYIKIDEDLDPEQVDTTIFCKVLRLQGIGFYVTSVRKGPQTEVTVSPFGLEESNREETYTIDGYVTGAEIEDLNADGSPELLVYTQSFGSGSYGKVLAFSVNNRKSVSMAYLPPVTENPTLSKGYMGHDEFRVMENYLIQRFPIYNDGDSNANPTGGTRQITYTLEEGEAMRQFKVKSVVTLNR